MQETTIKYSRWVPLMNECILKCNLSNLFTIQPGILGRFTSVRGRTIFCHVAILNQSDWRKI